MFEVSRQIRSAVVHPHDGIFASPSFPEFDFAAIWRTLRRGWVTILITTAVALCLALLFVLIVPHRFTAVTQILIDPTDLHAVGTEASPSNQASDAALLYVETQVSVLTSDSVLRRVVTSENLADDPEFVRRPTAASVMAHNILGKILGKLGVAQTPIGPPDNALSALNELKRHVHATRTERTYVIDVGVTSKDPAKAARIANAIGQAYLTEQTQIRSDAARQVSQSLSGRLHELQDRVREAEDRVESYKANNNIVDANGELVDEQQLADMNNQLSAAHARAAEAKARLDQIESMQKSNDILGAFPEALQSPTITALRTQYAEIMRREAEQSATLGARHPAVIDIQAQANRLRQMIEDEVNRTAMSTRASYQSAIADETALSTNLDALKRTAITTNKAMVELRELEREVQASRAVYESFLVRARETGEQERIDTKNIRIISKAELPLQRSSPPSNLLVALAGLFLGIGAGSGIALMRGTSGTASPAIGRLPAPSSLTVPVLAVVPSVDVAFGLDTVDDPKSRFARGIRKVYETLLTNRKMFGRASVLIVADGEDNDAAAVALTLAALAAENKSVLLIDADRERRTLAALDADRSEGGLVDVAAGRQSLSEAIVLDSETNVNLLPFISEHSRRQRPISDQNLKQAFAQTKQFDMVIVAAFDPRHDPTASFFAGLVDQIIVVARADDHDDAGVERLAERLGFDPGKIRGTVLTGVGTA